MKKITLILLPGFMLMGSQLHAGNGDLFVNGNLGVGTTSPVARLQVGGNSELFGSSNKVYGNNDAAAYYIGHYPVSGSDGLDIHWWGGVRLGDATGIALQVPNGNVGIGTTNPGLYKLLVAGALRSDGVGSGTSWSFGGNGDFAIDAPGISAGRFIVKDGTGNVGIGTTNPAGSLEVARGTAPNGTAVFRGTTNSSHFNYSTTEDTYIRGGKTGSVVHINDSNIGNVNIVENGGRVGIGTPSPAYTLDVAGTIRANNVSPSDLRFKEKTESIESALDKVLSIQGVSFFWKTKEFRDKNFPEGKHFGVIAQEIEKVLPEVVNTASDGTKAVAYTEIIPVLIEAIKEQQKLIEEQRAELREIRAELGAR
jgi:hypothetical protein